MRQLLRVIRNMELRQRKSFVALFIILSLLKSILAGSLPDRTRQHGLTPNQTQDLIKTEWDSWEVPHYIRDGFYYYLSGYDDEGRPIVIFEIGRYDFKTALDLENNSSSSLSSPLTKFIDHTICTLDQLANENAEKGPGEIVLIYDLEQFSLRKVISAEVAKFALQSLNKFGPIFDKVSYGFFLNTAFIAETYINTFRPIVGHFLSKFDQFGTRKEEWIPKVLRKLPSDQLPPQYGGHTNFTPVAIFP